METFSALLALCAGNSPVTGEFTTERPVTRSFDVFFDLHLNKRLSKQWWGWWFETPSCSLWRHCNDQIYYEIAKRSVVISLYRCLFDRYLGSTADEALLKYQNDRTTRLRNFATPGPPFNNTEQIWSHHGWIIICTGNCEKKILIHSQTSSAASLKFGNR